MKIASPRFNGDSKDRRGYIRVLDAVAMEVTKLEAEMSITEVHSSPKQDNPSTQTSELIASRFAGFNQLNKDNPEAAAYILELEKQLGIDASATPTANDNSDFPTHKVSLSGSGIAFSHDLLLRPGDRALLRIKLFPSGKMLQAVVTIISVSGKSDAVSGGKHAVRAVFSEIDGANRKLLLDHINFILSRM